MKITELTDAQKAKFPEYVDKWIKIGLCTEPANRKKSEVAIKNLYALAKLKEPKVIWLPCPISAAIASVVYAKIINKKITVRSAVGLAVRSAVSSDIDSAVRSDIDFAVGSAVSSDIDFAVSSAVSSAVGSAVRSAVSSAVSSAVRSAVDFAVGSAVSSAVRSDIGSDIDSAVRSDIDFAVGSAVSSDIDFAVSSAVSSAVRSDIDFAVGSAVSSAVGSAVRSAVSSAGMAYFGGSLWCGYQSWADYFNKELSIPINRNYLDLAENCGYYWTLDSVCFASERPNLIKLDDMGRLHNEFGMSISYPSGWGLFHWHGVSIPREWIENKQSLTAKMAITWPNIEQRRAAIEIIGWDIVLKELDVNIINKDDDPYVGELLEVNLPDSGKEKFLRVLCGTGRIFSIPVPKEMKTALEANAWTYGLDKYEFKPEIRT